MPDYDATMSFGDHLDELRRRLVLVLVGLLPIIVLGLVFGKWFVGLLSVPVLDALREAGQPATLQLTEPLEGFIAYLKVSFILAILVGFPWILIQLWLFVAPGLYKRERRFVYFLIPLSTLLTALGMLFLYYILLPITLFFLIAFNASLISQPQVRAPLPASIALPSVPVLPAAPGEDDIDAGLVTPGMFWLNERANSLQVLRSDGSIASMPLQGEGMVRQEFRVGRYLSLVFTLALVFALASQLPVVMLLLSWVGLLEVSFASRYRRHVGFGCAVAGAVLTPQDPISMVALGGALYLLYELGLLLMRFVPASSIARVGEDDGA
ncbi:MAG: hypothetical protein Tsb0013_08790 [Phycisphaerales bacterium]